MSTRRAAQTAQVAADEENEQVSLRFNEPLTWRPGKPIPTDQLLKRLDRLSKELGEMDQDNVDQNSLVKVAKELASHQLLSHKDKGVRAYTACCVVDILKLCAPNAPFTQSQLKDIFNLCVNSIIPALFDPSHPYNNQHKYVLFSFAEVKSIVLLLDVDGSDSLLLHLFTTIFDGVSGLKSNSGEQVAKDVEFNMQEMLGALIDEATSLPAKVVDVIMAQFLRAAAPGGTRDRHNHVPVDENQATLLLKEEPEAYQIAKNLCHLYPEKMARFVSQYFSDVIMDATGFVGRPNAARDDDSDNEDGPVGPSESDLRELKKAHLLIREIWRAAPMILQNVVPQVEAELSADNVHLRQLATETLGDMISGIGAAGPPPPPTLDPVAYPPLRLEDDSTDSQSSNVLTTPLAAQSFSQTHPVVYHNFLNRKNDKAPTIRAAWTIAVGYILSTSAGGIGLSREEEAVLIQGLGEKLLDSDERVRLAAVKAIETFKFQDVILKLGPNGGVSKEGSVLSALADRCRDKRPAVRVEAMSLLGKLWGVGTGELLAGHELVATALSGIPSRILNAFYANDPELNVLLDRVLYECLVPLAYPPQPKKSARNLNGGSQSQSQSQSQPATSFDQDAIRAERILLLARSLDDGAKKAFFALQARQPQFSKIVQTFIQQCENYNGGVMDEAAAEKTANLEKTIRYIARFFPDDAKTRSDLHKFAKVNDRRNYHLVRYVVGWENDFKTVHKALKELTKRIQSSKEPFILDTLLPLLYRSGCIMFNRSHLATIMEYSKTDKNGFGAISHEILNEISQRNPDLFKAHIGELCKDLTDQAPSANGPNDPASVETLKACAAYARKYPAEVPMDRKFVQTLISYALYGSPPKAAKYAVHILLAKRDEKSLTYATDLLQKTMKAWEYGGSHFLNKLTTLSQLELLAATVVDEVDNKVLDICVQQILLQVRTEASESDPKWVEDADLDDECWAKCLALKTVVNRIRSMEDIESAKANAKATWNLLRALVTKGGEISKGNPTPNHHRSRLRLLAAKLILKLCTQKHFDDQLSPTDFNRLAQVTQDSVAEVRHGFVTKLQKYLAEGKLRSRYYTIVFLMAFEPVAEFKQRVETWISSRARHFQLAKQPVMEAIMPRLISLLAHHPDYSEDPADLLDHARYLVFYTSLVATESNLGLINKYAERVKQTHDALDPKSENHRVLSDLAQAVIRKWQEKKNWTFEAYPGKVGLPMGLYTALQSHEEAQEVAEKQYIPDGLDEKLDELLRAMDRKKKRKSVEERHDSRPPAKRAKAQPKSGGQAKDSKPQKAASKKTATSKKRSKPRDAAAGAAAELENAERRRSGRSRKSQTYVERDSSEDDQEMLEGVAEWEYGDQDENSDEPGDGGSDAGEGSGSEEAVDGDDTHSASASASVSAAGTKRPSAGQTVQEDESELSDVEADSPEATPSPPKSNGRKQTRRTVTPSKSAALPTRAPPERTKSSKTKGAASAKKAPSRTSARPARGKRTKTADAYDMDDDDD
ncbi:hypothetical protein VTK73DRAFT_1839 [Phialemonium thermophilum]|uniref:Sister chromatid cohesion protein PDS5 n=1 Tax=Phialemonium thermophilum TaxID=223376 RepID=A0ABR3X7Z9_9PEZI